MKSNSLTQNRKSSQVDRSQNRLSAVTIIHAAAIAAGTFTAFIPTFKNEFVDWDDYETLLNNIHFRGLGWPELRWMFTTFHMGHYQPLSWLTFSLDYLIWGMNPVGYHLTNLILHAANAAVFFFLCRQIFIVSLPFPASEPGHGIDLAAAVAALLFSIHPLRVESVAWATERRDGLSGLFFLIMLYAYFRASASAANRSHRGWLLISISAFVLSLLAKATAITAPAVLLLLDLYPLRRLSGPWRSWFGPGGRQILWEKVPFALFALLFGALAIVAQHEAGALRPVQQYFFSYRLGQAFYGVMFYLWKSVFPIRLSPLYELPYDFANWFAVFILCGAAVLGLTVALVLLRRRWPVGLACWIYYLLLLAPVLGIAQSGPQLVADRYSYLSCTGWAVAVGGGLFGSRQFFERHSHRKTAVLLSIAVALVLLVLSVMTWRQTEVWRDTRTLWRHVIATGPPSSIAHYNLGRRFEDENRLDLARDYYRRAVEINPANPDAHYNLARLLAKQGDTAEAIRHYRLALEIRPKDADTHNNLGLLLAREGDLDTALKEFREAIHLDSNYGKAFFNSGRILARESKFDVAILNYRRAAQLNPEAVEVLVALGDALLRNGETQQAVVQLEKAVALKPNLAEVHETLARAFLAQGKATQAEIHYQEALRLLKAQTHGSGQFPGSSQ